MSPFQDHPQKVEAEEAQLSEEVGELERWPVDLTLPLSSYQVRAMDLNVPVWKRI